MIKEIWNTLTLGGKRALSLSVTGFTLYALSGIAMMYIVLKSLEAVMSGSSVLLWYWIALAACLLIKGGSNILADVKKHHAGFDIAFQIIDDDQQQPQQHIAADRAVLEYGLRLVEANDFDQRLRALEERGKSEH